MATVVITVMALGSAFLAILLLGRYYAEQEQSAASR
jgi:hypothetical protein